MNKKILSNEFPHLIQQLKHEKNIQYQKLARMIGVSPTSISYWSKGKKKMSYEHAMKLIEILNQYNCTTPSPPLHPSLPSPPVEPVPPAISSPPVENITKG